MAVTSLKLRIQLNLVETRIRLINTMSKTNPEREIVVKAARLDLDDLYNLLEEAANENNEREFSFFIARIRSAADDATQELEKLTAK